MPSASVSFQLEKGMHYAKCTSQQKRRVGYIYRKQATALEKGIHGCLGQGVTAKSPEVSLGDDEKALYTHRHAAQLRKCMEDCAPHVLNSEFYDV